jgi:hypothetical protein
MIQSGYYINVSKLKKTLDTWEREHGSGHAFYFKAYLGEQISLEEAHAAYTEFYAKFPPHLGYCLALTRVPPQSSSQLRNSHFRDGDHYRIGAEVLDR